MATASTHDYPQPTDDRAAGERPRDVRNRRSGCAGKLMGTRTGVNVKGSGSTAFVGNGDWTIL
jgi:hypothetical protein